MLKLLAQAPKPSRRLGAALGHRVLPDEQTLATYRQPSRQHVTCPHGHVELGLILEGLDKGTQPDRLVVGIDTVAAGEALLAPGLTRRLIEQYLRRLPTPVGIPEPLQVLTEREREVLVLMARELSDDAIAAAPVVSGATVKPHVDPGARQLVLRGRVQAVLAYETGLVQPGS